MCTVYLIRHARPAGAREHTCGYREDVPLGPEGRHQAELLRERFRDKKLSAVYTSPLRRAAETAGILSGGRIPVQTIPALQELDTGAWTGLTFEEIRRRYPAEYRARGEHPGTVAPPDGESFIAAGERMERAVAPLIRPGNIAVVAHGGVNRGWLCRLLGRDPDDVLSLRQPFGGISEIQFDGGGRHVLYVGRQPFLYPDQLLVQAFWERYETPLPVREHCRAVARCALELADQTDIPLDRGLLNAACLLHDLVRDRPDHPRAGAEILEREGYPELAGMVAAHHDLPDSAGPETRLLYLADKLIKGTQRVTLEERFQAKRDTCKTPEALSAWESRYRRALQAAQWLHLTQERGNPAWSVPRA